MRLTLILALTAACSRPPAQEPTSAVADEDLAPIAAPTPTPTPKERASALETTAPALTREALDRVLDGGPGAFLAQLEVRPHFDGKRFDGWELMGFSDTSSGLARSGLLPGDVVKRVNDHSLERPENLHDLWQTLRGAASIVVAGLRAGQPFEMRFQVSGVAGPPPGTSAL